MRIMFAASLMLLLQLQGDAILIVFPLENLGWP